jgi:hypothetical protein
LFERLLVEALPRNVRAAVIRDNTPNDTKGAPMKTIYVRFFFAFFALAAFAVASRAQAVDKLVVNIPHDFVASGKTLPAGTYTINRINDFNNTELSLFSFESRDGVLLISSDVAPTREDKPALTFNQVGNQYFLTKIETLDHIFTIPVSAKPAVQVAMKNQSAPAASGASGSN